MKVGQERQVLEGRERKGEEKINLLYLYGEE